MEIIFRLLGNFVLRLHQVSFGKAITCRGCPLISNRGQINLGDDVKINSGQGLNPIGGDSQVVLVTFPKAEIRIGNRVGLSNCTLVAWKKITIEDDVLLGGGCKIYDTDFHPVNYRGRVNKDKSLTKAIPVTIGKGAFIGAHSLILKGVTIGQKSIVGAGSVVAKNIPPGEVWAGNPAKFVRNLKPNEL